MQHIAILRGRIEAYVFSPQCGATICVPAAPVTSLARSARAPIAARCPVCLTNQQAAVTLGLIEPSGKVYASRSWGVVWRSNRAWGVC